MHLYCFTEGAATQSCIVRLVFSQRILKHQSELFHCLLSGLIELYSLSVKVNFNDLGVICMANAGRNPPSTGESNTDTHEADEHEVPATTPQATGFSTADLG